MASIKSLSIYFAIFLLTIAQTISADDEGAVIKTSSSDLRVNNKGASDNKEDKDNKKNIDLPVLINIDIDSDGNRQDEGNVTKSITLIQLESQPEIQEMLRNVTMDSMNQLNLANIEELMMDPLNRTKRQSLAGLAGLNLAALGGGGGGIPNINNNNNNGNGKNVESLLASCQLTNLLMYNLLQQKQQTSPFPAGIIQPFGAINPAGNLLFPQAETLSTYLSTSTYVTKMTTTALVTIPLLFGNKPVPTTITRTKTYDVTTSEIKTLTSTIRPTFTQLPASALMSTVDLNPTPAVNTESTVLPPNSSNDDKSNDNDNEKNEEVDQEVSNSKKSRLLESEEPKLTRTFAELTANKRLKPHTLSTNTEKTRGGRGGGKRRKNSRPTVNVDSYDNNVVSTPKNTEPFISRRDPSQYKILRDNRENRERTPVVQQQVVQQQQNSYQPQNPFVYEDRDRTPAYNSYNNRYNNNPTESYQPSAPARGSRGDIIYRQQQYQQHQRQVEPQPDPEYVQYPDDYAYYTRRLKRGQQQQGQRASSDIADSEEYPLEREYLLEPSFQGDFSQGFEQVEKCPPVPAELSAKTVTFTETRTITKFVNPPSSSSSISTRQNVRGTVTNNNNGSGRAYTDVRSNSNSNSGSTRGRTRSRSRSTTTPTTSTTEAAVPLSGQEEYTGRRFRTRSRNYDQGKR